MAIPRAVTLLLALTLGTSPAVVGAPSSGAPPPPAPVRNGDLVTISGNAAVTHTPGTATYDFIGGELPQFSPDGRQVALLNTYGGPAENGLWVHDRASGTQRRVSDIVGTGLAWSPDGTTMVVSHGATLDLVDVATGAVRHLYDDPGGLVTEPAWSPDGTRIAFSTGAAIKLIRPDGTGVRGFTKGGGLNSDPDWSPDSRTIAFITDRYNPAAGRQKAELVTLPRSGQGEPVRVSHLAYPQGIFLIDLAWSPDGRKIAVLQFNRNALPDQEDSDERFKVRGYLPDGSHSYSLTGPLVGDDGPEGLDWAPRLS